MRFLLVEDSDALAEAVASRLALDGHGVDRAATLAEAEIFMDSAPYDLVLLDISLPDGDGRTFLAQQRRAGRETPVIMMTASASVTDRVATLDQGADDYLTKPFDFEELQARCRAVLRRHSGVADSRRQFAGFTFDALGATVTVGGEVRALRARELRLLEILLSRPGQTYSKPHLIDRLFSFDEEVSDNAIEVYIGRLRRKLDGSGARLETLRGVGYRLIPE
ncbi:two-component system, OmpR family, response regulator TctD [Paracoccus isoporae]|uniref:Two-component system, OmpR family, response regulator TctD n=1 Tax=Paracoccus isoporae TaxID=591205 RepID=A0A1G6XH57_9RHOB|nr:response regulator transcription factor [Paracoccus isoporae]SDD77500.1 two-component system, OmpR family, response regulator TctD [Paracoccus isoporae]